MSFLIGMVVGILIGVYLANKDVRRGVNSAAKRLIDWIIKKTRK